jgi:hypothetical protein
MNRNFGFFRGSNVGTPGVPRVTPTVNVSVAYSGQSGSLSDFNIITYTITSNLPNATLYYTIENLQGNIQADDFTDNTLSGVVILNSSGSAILTKTIIKTSGVGEGHKKFNLRLRRNSITGGTLQESANTQLYEIIPISATGGNTTIVPNAVTGYGGPMGSKFHSFTNAATETFTISNYGNFVGNSSVWGDQLLGGYWSEHAEPGQEGMCFRNMIIGGGGGGSAGGGGAGEIGFWNIPLGNIAVGSYDMTVGQGQPSLNTGFSSNAANTIAFVGNVSLGITAYGGGRGGTTGSGSPGGCGGGSAIAGTPGGFTAVNFGVSQLPSKTIIYFPDSPSGGLGFGNVGLSPSGGGGGGVTGGGLGSGPNGLTGWDINTTYLGYTIDAQWVPNTTVKQYAGGGGGRYGLGSYGGGNGATGAGGPGQPGVKGSGAGGGNGASGGTGLIAIRYPYTNAYRFVTGSVLI